MANFKQRWNIKSNWQVFVIILVFAITGSTAAMISKPILNWLGISKETNSTLIYSILYILIILPIYQVLLVGIGFIFGQFEFFWAFEKKVLKSIGLGFLVNSKKNLE